MSGLRGEIVPVTERRQTHRATYAQASHEGYALTCECGWSTTARFARIIHLAAAQGEMHSHQADHAKHMALVHEAKTHGFNNCGRLCIYDRKTMEAQRRQGASDGR